MIEVAKPIFRLEKNPIAYNLKVLKTATLAMTDSEQRDLLSAET